MGCGSRVRSDAVREAEAPLPSEKGASKASKASKGGDPRVGGAHPQINCQGTLALALRLERGRCGHPRYFSKRIDTILRSLVLTKFAPRRWSLSLMA